MRTGRRALLLGGAGLVLLGCTASSREPDEPTGSATGPAEEPAPVDPDAELRARLLAREDDMITRFDAAIAVLPTLSELLGSLRTEHTTQRDAVAASGPALPMDGPAVPSATPEPSVSPTPPADQAELLQELATAESDAFYAAREDCLTAIDGELAALTAAMHVSGRLRTRALLEAAG